MLRDSGRVTTGFVGRLNRSLGAEHRSPIAAFLSIGVHQMHLRSICRSCRWTAGGSAGTRLTALTRVRGVPGASEACGTRNSGDKTPPNRYRSVLATFGPIREHSICRRDGSNLSHQ